ncbi:hypothetical protein HDF25_001872 [Pedobacter cryoconitis]|uniref:Uncharacterized protein n=1 Tax=Pedobacter cryoconitis TaxID=188932 RepID=A0A7X0MJK8_9SPHI|nr:hypothetical protein [Pedobacter cryoconitis]
MIPMTKIEMASTLMTCMILMSILVGLSGSFFLKKYISQMYKIMFQSGTEIKNQHILLFIKYKAQKKALINQGLSYVV